MKFASLLVLTLVVAQFQGKAALSAQDQVFSAPQPEQLKQEVLFLLADRGLDQTPLVDAIKPSWEFADDPNAHDLFDALMQTLYIADDDVRNLVDQCRELTYSPTLLSVNIPESSSDSPLVTNNVRYFLARHLAILNAYDEASELFQRVNLEYVVDPAGCLFYQAVCDHRLLAKDSGLEALTKLLEQTEEVPVRYQKLGELMKKDLEDVEEKTIGEVARQMRDVERRLNLGRADEDTIEVEEKIIATLDELIKKMEDQQQQQQGGGGGGAQQLSGDAKPAEESYLGGVKGPGETDKKELGNKDNWGNVPPKAREAAKNMLDRQFPAHYRRAVEAYLKKVAERPAPNR